MSANHLSNVNINTNWLMEQVIRVFAAINFLVIGLSYVFQYLATAQEKRIYNRRPWSSSFGVTAMTLLLAASNVALADDMPLPLSWSHTHSMAISTNGTLERNADTLVDHAGPYSEQTIALGELSFKTPNGDPEGQRERGIGLRILDNNACEIDNGTTSHNSFGCIQYSWKIIGSGTPGLPGSIAPHYLGGIEDSWVNLDDNAVYRIKVGESRVTWYKNDDEVHTVLTNTSVAPLLRINSYFPAPEGKFNNIKLFRHTGLPHVNVPDEAFDPPDPPPPTRPMWPGGIMILLAVALGYYLWRRRNRAG